MYFNICFSPTGGTKKVADILSKSIFTQWQEIDLCRDLPPMTLTDKDICLISVPSYGGRVPGIALDRLSVIHAAGAKAILVCVYGNRDWDDTLTELQDVLEQCGFVCAAAVAAVAEHSVFRQFAAGRPDDQDTAELTGFAGEIRQKLSSDVLGTLSLTGSHGTYKAYGGIPFKPEADKHCVSCGLCAASCPVGAIDRDDPRQTDKDKCISCMRCVSMCPRHARDFNAIIMNGAAAAMAPKLDGRKSNHLFI